MSEAASDARYVDSLRAIAFADAIQRLRYFEALRTLAFTDALAAQQQAASSHAASVPARASAPTLHPAGASPLSAAVLAAINARRAASGLPPLTMDAHLTAAAEAYASTLSVSGSFGHSVDGTSFDGRIRAAGFLAAVPLGEVIALSSAPAAAEDFAQMWMDSPAHRELILSSSFRYAGIGCVAAGGAVYCVADLAG